MARRVPRLRIPLFVYLFARYFGAGVIVATAFIHLLNPAYAEIGPQTCVGMTGHWADYPWCPAIVLTSISLIFLLDFAAERYVEVRYGISSEQDVQAAVTRGAMNGHDEEDGRRRSQIREDMPPGRQSSIAVKFEKDYQEPITDDDEGAAIRFKQQIGAFLILEFGVLFHSIIIGLNLGVVGAEFNTLYPVLVFHQSFEGLGIGARMSAIPFQERKLAPLAVVFRLWIDNPNRHRGRFRCTYHLQFRLLYSECRLWSSGFHFGGHSDLHWSSQTAGPRFLVQPSQNEKQQTADLHAGLCLPGSRIDGVAW